MAAFAIIGVSFGSIARRIGAFLRGSARSMFRTRDIGVCDAFIEEAEFRERRFQRHVVTNDGLTVVAAYFICTRCNTGRAFETKCTRDVFEGSVMGRTVGTMYWSVPTCNACDREVPLDITNPILVRHGKGRDGYRDIPVKLRTFLQISFKSA